MKTLLAVLFLAASLVAARADDLTLAVQTKLTGLGYYDGSLDGAWGSQTSAAVRRFQVARKIRVTGDLNPATLNALGIKQEPAKPQKTKAAPQMSRGQALADIFVGGPYLTAQPAFQVQVVQSAQKNLKLLGFYAGPVDGQPTPALKDSLRAYQKSNRFKATGRLDKTTLQALNLLTLPPEN
ncbi:MAG: peptidoglycan-binding domain-containing protein [Chthoniobacterales bacterium]